MKNSFVRLLVSAAAFHFCAGLFAALMVGTAMFAEPCMAQLNSNQIPRSGTGLLPGHNGGAIAVGSRVLASPFSDANDWHPATVLKIEQGAFVVRLDQKPGVNYSDVFKVPDTSVKTGNVGPAPSGLGPINDFDAKRFKLDPMAGATGGVAAAKADSSRTAPIKTAAPPQSALREYYPQATNDNTKGQGAPPSGVYELYKLSGSMLVKVGSIEIQGNTYRGLALQGPFHPFAVGADGAITWSAGLSNMPQGWKLLKSFYTGLDPGGKPRMEVKYLGIHNTLETADAYRN